MYVYIYMCIYTNIYAHSQVIPASPTNATESSVFIYLFIFHFPLYLNVFILTYIYVYIHICILVVASIVLFVHYLYLCLFWLVYILHLEDSFWFMLCHSIQYFLDYKDVTWWKRRINLIITVTSLYLNKHHHRLEGN
jgi:hypothetical protein